MKKKARRKNIVGLRQTKCRNRTQHEKIVKCLFNIAGVSFKSEHIVKQPNTGKYFLADFHINRNIILEVDGTSHRTRKQMEKDEIKDYCYLNQGYDVYRISNENVNDIDFMVNLAALFRHRSVRFIGGKIRMLSYPDKQIRKQDSLALIDCKMLHKQYVVPPDLSCILEKGGEKQKSLRKEYASLFEQICFDKQ